MIVAATYIGLALLSSLRFLPILKWLINHQPSKESPAIEFSRDTFMFFLSHVLTFFVGYFGLTALNSVFYYYDPLFIQAGILIMLISFFWSFFYSFKQKNYSIPFLLGFYCFFSWHFLWLYPVSFCLCSLLFNQDKVGNVFALILCYLGILLFDIDPVFSLVNTLIVGVVTIKHSYTLSHIFSKQTASLLDIFKSRNIHF